MKRFPTHSALAAIAVLALFSLAGAQDKVKLTLKAEAGRIAKYKSNVTAAVEAAGQKITFEQEEVGKTTFTKVDPNGNITVEEETESMSMTVNGQKVDAPDEAKKKNVSVIRPDGTLVSMKTEGGSDPEQDKLAPRIFQASKPVFTPNPVGVGDKWSQDYKANADTGTRDGHADFEVQAFEKVKDADCVKIKMTYSESGSSPLSSTCTVWVEKTSGDTVAIDFDLHGVQFGGDDGPKADAKGRTERIFGSPLPTTPGETQTDVKKDKTIDDMVKDYEKLDGLFTLYRKREAGRTTIYMELREDQLDKLLWLQVTAATGTSTQITAGDPVTDLMFKFQKMDEDKIMMVVPNYNFRADKDKPIARAVERSFAESFLESYKIEAKQPDRKSLLINISDLFRGDISEISQRFAGGSPIPITGLGGGGGYTLDKEKTFINSLKAFPENLYAQTTYNFSKSGGGGGGLAALLGGGVAADPRSMVIKLDYNLMYLPDTGYMPRRYDSRVGYFKMSYQDFTNDVALNMKVDNIIRWRLEKADPTLALSPPKKQIVYWLDNAMPLEYRDAVRDGLLIWNKAFEKIGFKDVVVVKQMPDDADFDIGDVRYNMVRWITSEDAGYAVALFRANPITGEIINACINVDSNLVRFINMERVIIVDPAAYFEQPTKVLENPWVCRLGNEAVLNAAAGDLTMRILRDDWSAENQKDYLNSFIRWVIAHESGHNMGLRHNFIASTELTMAQLANQDLVKKYMSSASVMDYVPFNLAQIKEKNPLFYSLTVGQYDQWAIEYGYKSVPGATTPDAEVPALKAVASQCNQQGHAWQSDEVADGFDPNVTRFDLSKYPLDYWTQMMKTNRFLIFTLSKRAPKLGDSFWNFTRDFTMLVGQYANAASQCARYIGGLYYSGNYKGDPGEKPTIAPIDGPSQIRAFNALNTYIFAPNAFNFPKSYYEYFTPNPNIDMISAFLGGRTDYPVMTQFSNLQASALRSLFSPPVLDRVANNEFKATDLSKALTLVTLFSKVGANVWAELQGGKNIPVLRRNLQRSHLDTLIGIVTNPNSTVPPDAKTLAWYELRKAKAGIMASKNASRDVYTKIHLEESVMRINRALNALQTIGGSAPPAPSLLEQLLGGGVKK